MSKLLIFILLITSCTLFPTEDEGGPSSPITTLSKKDRIELCDDLQDLIFNFLPLIDIRSMAGVSRSYRSYVIDWKTDENRTDRPEVDKEPFICCLPRRKLSVFPVYDQIDSGRKIITGCSSWNPLDFFLERVRLFWSKGILFNPQKIDTDLQICNVDGSKTRLKLEHFRDLPKILSPKGEYAATVSSYETIGQVKQTLIFKSKSGDFYKVLPGYFGAFSPDEKVVLTWTEIPMHTRTIHGPNFRLNFYNLETGADLPQIEIDVGFGLINRFNCPASFGYSKNGKLAVLFETGHISVVNIASIVIQEFDAPTGANRMDADFPNSAICFTPDDKKMVVARPNGPQTLIHPVDAETGVPNGERKLIPGTVKSAKYSKDDQFLDVLDDNGYLYQFYSMSLDFPSVEPIKASESFFQRNRIKIALVALIVGATTGLLFARRRIKMALIKGKIRRKKLELAKKLVDEKKKKASEGEGGKVL